MGVSRYSFALNLRLCTEAFKDQNRNSIKNSIKSHSFHTNFSNII